MDYNGGKVQSERADGVLGMFYDLIWIKKTNETKQEQAGMN